MACFALVVILSRRQKRVQLMRIREKDARKRQQAGGQEGTYRRKATPVKRYAGDLLAPVSVTRRGALMPPSLVRASQPRLSAFLPLRVTCKACETDRWARALPLAAWEPATTP